MGRNQPCPCGSGRKAKLCCGVRRGPPESEVAAAFLSFECRRAALALLGLGDGGLGSLWNDMFDLPAEDLSLLVTMPDLLTPDIDRLSDAVAGDDPEGAEAALPPVLARYDTPVVRAKLARAVVALRERGGIPERVAAIALIDLGSESTAFLQASLVHSVAVLTGARSTPAGLVLAD